MKQVEIQSRLINSVYFSAEEGNLYLKLANGTKRLFTGVPEDAVVQLCAAKSPGQYYLDHIRAAFKRVG
jgi:hypothetical protein